ncbi:MAG TPA: zinc-binding dehydrogenase [Acidimicrobiia bacterium]|nr:zinc-binding dehydrogenase [Acidimicrobiia bacterium]
MRVRAAIALAVNEIRVGELELDEPRFGEVLVRLVATGICHTDLSMVRGNLPVPFPLVAGHEGAGVVEAVGPGVTDLAVGDHVICSITFACGTCYTCVRHQLPCELGAGVAFTGQMPDGTMRLHDDGGRDVNHIFCQSSFATHTVVPAAAAVKVREDAPLAKVAALGCGVGTGLGAVLNRAQVPPGSSVLVMGAGGVGLAAMLGARLAGASTVIAADLNDAKLDKAKSLAADVLVNPKSADLGDAVDALTEGRGVDYAFDAVGADGTLETCFRATRPGGTTVAIGIMNATVSSDIDTYSLLMEKTLTGTFGGSLSPKRDIPAFVDLFMAGRLDIGALIDHECKLDDVAQALDGLERGEFTRAVILH